VESFDGQKFEQHQPKAAQPCCADIDSLSHKSAKISASYSAVDSIPSSASPGAAPAETPSKLPSPLAAFLHSSPIKQGRGAFVVAQGSDSGQLRKILGKGLNGGQIRRKKKKISRNLNLSFRQRSGSVVSKLETFLEAEELSNEEDGNDEESTNCYSSSSGSSNTDGDEPYNNYIDNSDLKPIVAPQSFMNRTRSCDNVDENDDSLDDDGCDEITEICWKDGEDGDDIIEGKLLDVLGNQCQPQSKRKLSDYLGFHTHF
jgi:hypothetical protein